MKLVLKSASFVFHPIWMPFLGTLLYFLITPRFFPLNVVQAKLMAIAIMTIFIPLVFFFMLKTLGQVSSHFMPGAKERKLPLIFYAALGFVILKFVLDAFDYPELYFFFFGIFISTLLNFFLILFRVKASLHMTGLAGLTAFTVLLSLHFNLSLVYTISFLILVMGLTASSRLYYKAHTPVEMWLGLLVGLVPQIGVAYLWL